MRRARLFHRSNLHRRAASRRAASRRAAHACLWILAAGLLGPYDLGAQQASNGPEGSSTSQADPSQADPSQADPSQADPSQPTLPGSAFEAVPLLQQQRWQEAIELLRPWVRQHPADSQGWRFLGMALHGAGEYQAAYDAHAKTFDDPATGPQARYQAARALARLGKTEDALGLLARLRETRRVDLNQAAGQADFESLRDDPRFAALGSTADELARPFVEPARILHEWRGEAAGDAFGWIARDLGDVDGDGVRDVVTSAPNKALPAAGEPSVAGASAAVGASAAAGANAGRVYAYSGQSGRLLWTRDGEPGWLLGRGVERAGDVDGDGVPDAFASAPGGDRAFVFSGKDGRTLLEIEAAQEGEQIGQHGMGVGDVDGDGHSDLWLGAPAYDLPASRGEAGSADGKESEAVQDAGRAALYSGKDGSLLFEVFGTGAGQRLGETVAGSVVALPGAADPLAKNGHERSDSTESRESAGRARRTEAILMVGLPGAARAHVYRGLGSAETPQVLRGEISAQSYGGMFMSVVGDLDADGAVDLYVSDWQDGVRGASTGRIYVYSGADGRRLLTLAGESAGDGFGIGPAQAGDVDGDGHDDLVVGAWQHRSAAAAGGRVYLLSGRNGTTLRTLTSRVMGETLGFDAQGLGDVDGDGKIDLLLTSAWSPIEGPRSGRVFVVAGE